MSVLIPYGIVQNMKTAIVQELENFFARHPDCAQSHLARMAKVKQPVISRVLTGIRKDMMSENADKLRMAMRQIESGITVIPNTPTEHGEMNHGNG